MYLWINSNPRMTWWLVSTRAVYYSFECDEVIDFLSVLKYDYACSIWIINNIICYAYNSIYSSLNRNANCYTKQMNNIGQIKEHNIFKT